MNFQELLQKISALDTPVIETPVKEEAVAECGMGPMDPPKQQDNVTMSVNMNGSGEGGIRDLLNILRNIEQGSENPDLDSLNKMIGHMGGEPNDGPETGKVAIVGDDIPVEEFANEPDEMYASVGDVIPTGNDMHSKGAEAEKVNGGGNPMGVDEEALLARLSSLYESIKSR